MIVASYVLWLPIYTGEKLSKLTQYLLNLVHIGGEISKSVFLFQRKKT